MPNTGKQLSEISTMLAAFSADAGTSAANGRTDRAKELERIAGRVLNVVLGAKLADLNRSGPTFPAIDLGDPDAKIAVQVTVRSDREKVKDALNDFLKNDMEKTFSRLIVMMFVPRVSFRGEIVPDEKYADRQFSFHARDDVWDLAQLERQIEWLEDDQIDKIWAYLTEQSTVFYPREGAKKPVHLLPAVPAPSASFVEGSRDRELGELKELLGQGAPIFLWGVGGIGKTEVAIQLAKRFTPPEGAYFLHYYDMPGEGDAMRETILRADFADYRYQGADTDNRDREYKERMDILRTEYPGALLVIDNFDRTGKTMAELMADPAYNELTAMGIRLVFTTRSRAKNGYEIKPLDEQFLLTLMRDNLDGMEVSDDDLRRLIQDVEGHTLMVVLMARTLARSYGNLKPADIRTALKESRLNSTSFHKVENQHNPQNVQARIYDHMKALFVLSGMNDAEQDVLRCATLLPEDGMDAGLFQACLKDDRLNNIPDELPEELMDKFREALGDQVGAEEDLQALFKQMLDAVRDAEEERQDTMGFLIDRGWLAKGEKNLLTIHPVIREVCRGELEPTDENCGDFLDRLRNRYNLDREFYADQFTQIAKCFSMASDKLADEEGEFALGAGLFWDKLGQAQTSLRYDLRMVERRENNLSVDPKDLATAYNNVGESYRSLGDYQKTLEYQQKALAIREKVLPPDHPSLATSYNNVGGTYYALGDHQKALEYLLKALAIRERVLPPDHPDLATSYNNVGSTYGNLGDHQKELEYDLKALAICEKVLPPDHPDLATSYSNISATYGDIGDHEKELEYDLKALAIREKELPPDHPSLATSYNNIGITYSNLEQFPKALEYLEKAIVILKKSLPAEHPYIASAEENIQYVQFMAMLQEAGLSLEDLMEGDST